MFENHSFRLLCRYTGSKHRVNFMNGAPSRFWSREGWQGNEEIDYTPMRELHVTSGWIDIVPVTDTIVQQSLSVYVYFHLYTNTKRGGTRINYILFSNCVYRTNTYISRKSRYSYKLKKKFPKKKIWSIPVVRNKYSRNTRVIRFKVTYESRFENSGCTNV